MRHGKVISIQLPKTKSELLWPISSHWTLKKLFWYKSFFINLWIWRSVSGAKHQMSPSPSFPLPILSQCPSKFLLDQYGNKIFLAKIIVLLDIMYRIISLKTISNLCKVSLEDVSCVVNISDLEFENCFWIWTINNKMRCVPSRGLLCDCEKRLWNRWSTTQHYPVHLILSSVPRVRPAQPRSKIRIILVFCVRGQSLYCCCCCFTWLCVSRVCEEKPSKLKL